MNNKMLITKKHGRKHWNTVSPFLFDVTKCHMHFYETLPKLTRFSPLVRI